MLVARWIDNVAHCGRIGCGILLVAIGKPTRSGRRHWHFGARYVRDRDKQGELFAMRGSRKKREAELAGLIATRGGKSIPDDFWSFASLRRELERLSLEVRTDEEKQRLRRLWEQQRQLSTGIRDKPEHARQDPPIVRSYPVNGTIRVECAACGRVNRVAPPPGLTSHNA